MNQETRNWQKLPSTSVLISLLCIRGSRRESKRRQRLILLFKRVHFVFSALPYSGASYLGKIYANFSGETVTSSSVLDHWEGLFSLSVRLTTMRVTVSEFITFM